ncbi:MAG: 30S ribosomal protein S8 [Anaerolineales bacterium]|nr:30S ribosomal protein S8 [Anaerolineales bacterium]
MTVVDPIADMLTRIRNGLLAGHALVAMPNSKMKTAVAAILKEEGYIEKFEVAAEGSPQGVLRVYLKYMGERRERRPVITGLERVSRPGRRVYAGKREIPRVLSGLGVTIVSTPKGIMTGARARKLGVGGEVICKVW